MQWRWFPHRASVVRGLKEHLETHKTKRINNQIIWQETVRKIIDRLEKLGYTYWLLDRQKCDRQLNLVSVSETFLVVLLGPLMICIKNETKVLNYLWQSLRSGCNVNCQKCSFKFVGLSFGKSLHLRPRSILQNPGKTAVLPVLPPMAPLNCYKMLCKSWV